MGCLQSPNQCTAVCTYPGMVYIPPRNTSVQTMAAIQRIVALCARQRNEQRRRERQGRPRSRLVEINAALRDNLAPLDVYTDAAIEEWYRLPRQAILQLLEVVGGDLRRPTRRSYALSPQTQLLAALRFYATGSFLQVVGDGHGLCKVSVCRSVEAVTAALLRQVPAHIRFPDTREEREPIQQQFFGRSNIPQVVGAVDGTLVPIITPHEDSHLYISRKGYAAINTQVICDHQGVFLDVVARWPGSTHDAYVFQDSAIGREAAMSRGEWRLIGDSGYPLRPYLFTPVANPQDAREAAYNEAHRLARGVVERSIGRWKMRFRCLHKSAGGLLFTPAKACAVICVTAMLHNIAVRARAACVPEGEEEEEEGDGGDVHQQVEDQRAQDRQAGVEARRRVIADFF
ncbi:hypothetical protein ACEWY4_013006 [Coilia grayii]|uniref:Putative nuclease HARBI1 n=1 Tax=Coilia grayii TaxID=363190 RepID=A0ABD1JV14_9TELE